MNKWILSADLGQSVDPTAISILEVTNRRDVVKGAGLGSGEPLSQGWFAHGYDPNAHLASGIDFAMLLEPEAPATIDVRYLERLPLRLPYPAQIEMIAGMLRRAPLAFPKAALVVDQSGCGRPVVDLFRRVGLRPIAVTITAGDGESAAGGDDYRVSKLLLVSRLQALLHSGELRIAAELKEAKTLANELQDFRATFSESGYVKYGAREGAHDDLVLSVALGAWWASRKMPTVRFFNVDMW